MRCDPISWKQSLFTASDRANLFLHQQREGEGIHFRTVQPAHVQYILGAKAIDLRFFCCTKTHTPSCTHISF